MGSDMFRIISNRSGVATFLAELYLQSMDVIELGDTTAYNRKGLRSDIISFKNEANAGIPTEQLRESYPKIFFNYPTLAHNYACKRLALTQAA